MLDAAMLGDLREAAIREDWLTADDLYLELVIGATDTPDSFLVEALAPSLRLRQADALAGLVGQLLKRLRSAL